MFLCHERKELIAWHKEKKRLKFNDISDICKKEILINKQQVRNFSQHANF